MNAGDLITRFENLRKARSGWSARCSAHADRANSLSLRIAGDGRLLINCFAGCRPAEVMAAVGLELRDLFPQSPPSPGARRRRSSKLSPMDEARREILREARRQPWARPGVQLRYAITDWLRAADRLQEHATVLGECDQAWDAVDVLAAVERCAYGLLASLDEAA